MNDAFIVSFCRSAVTKAKKGGFRFTRSDDLAVNIIKALLAKTPQLDTSLIDDVIVGCANPEGEQGLQIGRQIALRAVGQSTPGVTVNRYCASGLETIAIATAKIRSGMGECYVAGGVESMSQIPMEGYKLAPNYMVASEHPDYIIGMGLTAEAVAKKYNVSREDQDLFALRSNQLASKAQQNHLFDDEIFPIEIEETSVVNDKKTSRKSTVKLDDGIRADTSLEALAALKPAFALGGSVTAGNSSQTSDGAGFALVCSENIVRQLGLQALGRLVSCAVAGVDPLYMGIGPCKAIPKALQMANKNLSDIDLIELNEAFAAQSLAVIREAGLDPDRVNVNGGAIALGHPLGCSGARLTMTLLAELGRRHQKYGLVTACVGGGQGIAAVLERL
ncbi:MAG: thiolase family protein [Saprospiraceae bacterium]|nr:thiolase family protein [Saprospiraceae bacterium]MBK7795519.1 thiolase family protein [Saprospiraceae bacterium]MBK8154030.1 thiolase family protein [Saprospiraceae bacterium]MBK9379083.1 thiolase family protein [Saprospiraceae bacterium]